MYVVILFVVQGDNSVIRLSRAVYFSIIAVFVLVLDEIVSSDDWDGFSLYGLQAFSRSITVFVRDALSGCAALCVLLWSSFYFSGVFCSWSPVLSRYFLAGFTSSSEYFCHLCTGTIGYSCLWRDR